MPASDGEPSPILLADYDYDLPPDRIAQRPVEPRDSSRLLVLHREDGRITHRIFREIGEELRAGDLLVINDTRVLPARLRGRRETDGQAELLLLSRQDAGRWEALARPARRLRPGTVVHLLTAAGEESGIDLRVIERRDAGHVVVDVPTEVEANLAAFGEMPLPPYIHERLDDAERYQTVFATYPGSAAAPTAGLHFTPELLARLEADGVGVARVTLHVGAGTFVPVKVEDARQHQMHAEWYHVPAATLAAIRATRQAGGRIIAVGTTSCRTLEAIADHLDAHEDLVDWTDLFIMPGFRFRVVDGLVTNFHLPKSTLLLLVSAFAGRDRVHRAYREAIDRGYRFYSFGDAMLIL